MKKSWLEKFNNKPSPLKGTQSNPKFKITGETMKRFVSKFKCARKPNEKEVTKFILQAAERSEESDFSVLSTCLDELDYTLTPFSTDENTLRALSKDGDYTLLIYGKMNENFAIDGHVVKTPGKSTPSLLKGTSLFLDPAVLQNKLYGPKHLKNVGKEESLYRKVKFVFSIDKVDKSSRTTSAIISDESDENSM